MMYYTAHNTTLYRFSLSPNPDKDPFYPGAEFGAPRALSRPLHFIFYLYYIHLHVHYVYTYIKWQDFKTNKLWDVLSSLPSAENHPLTMILCQNTKTYTIAHPHILLCTTHSNGRHTPITAQPSVYITRVRAYNILCIEPLAFIDI